MPTRITRTRSYSRRTLFGGRVTTRVTTSQTLGQTPQSPPRYRGVPQASWPGSSVPPTPPAGLTGAQLLEMQRLQAERLAAAREMDVAQQQAHMDALVRAPHGFSPQAVARWLHTVPGAVTTLVVFVLALILGFALDWPFLLVIECVALAIVDWQNLRTMHGAIGWRQWSVSRRGLAWFVGFLLVCYGWLFLPVVYAIQAWNGAATFAERVRRYQREQIAALEAEVFSDVSVPPPPPPIVPLAPDPPPSPAR